MQELAACYLPQTSRRNLLLLRIRELLDYFESRAWRVDGHIGQDEHAWTSANGRRQLGGMRGARHQPGGMLVAPNACVQVAKHGR